MRNCEKMTAVSVVVLALLGTPASADDLTVQSAVTIDGFNSTTVTTGFTSTDAFDSIHSCTTTNGVSCTTQNGYDHPPKNIHEFLCIPSSMAYLLTTTCSTLVNRNDGNDCHGNSPGAYFFGRHGVGSLWRRRT